jgi:hypothetical protein
VLGIRSVAALKAYLHSEGVGRCKNRGSSSLFFSLGCTAKMDEPFGCTCYLGHEHDMISKLDSNQPLVSLFPKPSFM